MTGTFDLAIRGGRVVSGGADAMLDIAVRGGSIAAIGAPGTIPGADKEIDATGLIVTPGGIDTHTHVAWPFDGTKTVDDFYTATVAAVLGGTTTIVDFVPPGESAELLDRCRARVDEAMPSVIDFGFHPILTSADRAVLAQIPAVVKEGFSSFKMYTTYEDRRVDDGAAWVLMQAIAAAGGLPGFHAENHEILGSALGNQVDEGRLSVKDYPESRPGLAEAETIRMVSYYARRLATPVYIFHVSGSEALAAVRDSRAAGSAVYAETCTHYLTLDDAVFSGPEPWRYVISPPIRSSSDRDDLWSAVTEGVITSVGSDHCAYQRAAKMATLSDHREIPAGASGIEARTPMLWHNSVNCRGLGPGEFVQVSAERAARALGMYPRKGVIAIGSDADLVLWDPEETWSSDQLQPASPDTFSLYDDINGAGYPRHVIVGGRVTVLDGRFVGARGQGRFVRRLASKGKAALSAEHLLAIKQVAHSEMTSGQPRFA